MAPDGAKFHCLRWRPEERPRARVIALHGLSCRAEDFAPLAEKLCAQGMVVEAWNLRGQGLDPQEARRGAWLEIDGHLQDLAAFASRETEFPEIPLFLCGESMGALLAIQAASRQPWRDRLAGLLLFVPVVGLAQNNPPWVKLLLEGIAKIAPNFRLRPSWFVQGSAKMPKLTRIEARQAELETAPHRLPVLTVRFLARMGGLIDAALPAGPDVTMPVALFTAGHDAFVTLDQQRAFFARLGSRDKTHFHYPESYHQLIFDLDAEKVVADARAWMESQLARHTSPR